MHFHLPVITLGVLEIDGVLFNGVDIIRWNEAGQITEFKVMLRP